MTQRDRDMYRRRLLDLGNRLKSDISGLTSEALRRSGGEASGSLSNAPLHLADLGTDNFDQEMAVTLLQNEHQVLTAIAAALDRLDAGKFGRCETCGKEIPAVRLQAVPYATHCVACAREIEQEDLNPADVKG
jgi:RNA polymerase-binding transcription factor DksA